MRGPIAEIELRGAGGEPVDLWRTIASHGLAELPPMRVDPERRSLELTLPVKSRRPRTMVIAPAGEHATLTVGGPRPGARETANLIAGARHVLRLDEDLSPFYRLADDDPDLRWVTRGAGRMARSPTVFEDVVKTICTTNCAWSATERMVEALVEHLGERAAGAPDTGPLGRAFPTPEAMAAAGEPFYREIVRAGYRGRYLETLATGVVEGSIVLEELGRGSHENLPDDEVERRLLELPGIGPYAAAHVMMMLGRYSKLILDSWTRPTYARLNGGRPVEDAAIVRRFRRYGTYAGLAFWLTVTADWA